LDADSEKSPQALEDNGIQHPHDKSFDGYRKNILRFKMESSFLMADFE
jgi:hypothetical protein